MKQLELQNSLKYALIDNEDYAKCKDHKWHLLDSSSGGTIQASVNGHIETLAVFLINPLHEKGDVDHKDRNTLNNQRSNLRFCTRTQNSQNRVKAHTRLGNKTYSTFKGVTKHDNKYRSRITVNGIRHSLGCFSTEIEAARAYNEAALKYFGEFSRLNNV